MTDHQTVETEHRAVGKSRRTTFCPREQMLVPIDAERGVCRACGEMVTPPARPDAHEALSLLLRRAAREHLGIPEGDYWPSDVADAQARAVIAAGYVIPPGEPR